MDRRKLHSVLLLSLFCFVDAQIHWTDRFESFGSFLDRQSKKNVKEVPISTTPRFTVLAPNVLRADSDENLFLQADGVSRQIPVAVQVYDFSKTIQLMTTLSELSAANEYHTLLSIRLPSENLRRDEKKDKYVYLKVTFEGFHSDEQLIPVTFHSGYMFIQTDKPIYRPGDMVRFRVFVSSLAFKALEGTIMADIKNPDGIVVYQTSRMKAVNGIYKDSFTLTEFVNEGMWTVTAKFDHWQQNTFNSTFEVKKYVLPAFNVTLTPKKPFFSLDDSELVVEITARYLYWQPVLGRAYVMFGVKHNEEMVRLPSVKQLTDLDGGTVTLTMNELRAAYPDVKSLVGKSIYVKASVLTQSGGDLVEAEKTGIRIVESPFVISFRDAPKYFKPGMPLDLTVAVNYHDGSPVQNVKLKVTLVDTPLDVTAGTARVSLNMPKATETQIITAETIQPGLRLEQQARRKIRVEPYLTSGLSHNYLYISAVNRRVSVGESLSLILSINLDKPEHNTHIKYITYLVLNKGKIITARRVNVVGQTVTAVQLTITSDMMPSFRFVAFYSLHWLGSNEEVVADSIWVDVTDGCVGKLSVGPEGGAHRDYMPGRLLDFKVTGDPGATVSLLAVDNSVFLLKRDKLTQQKMWDVVEQGDFGCTRAGGGHNAKGVFSDAGLLYFSNAGFKTDPRPSVHCSRSTRRRRSAERLQRKSTLESHYKDALPRRCCLDGLRDIPMRYSCTRRSLYITEGSECIRAFRYCCGTYRDEPIDPNMPTTPAPVTTTSAPLIAIRADFIVFNSRIPPRTEILERAINRVHAQGQPGLFGARGPGPAFPSVTGVQGEVYEEDYEEDGWDDEDESDETRVELRSKFYESWLWEDVLLPSAADLSGLASAKVERPLPDSITEWGVLAVSASPQTGLTHLIR